MLQVGSFGRAPQVELLKLRDDYKDNHDVTWGDFQSTQLAPVVRAHARLSVISQFDGPMIKVGDGCRAIETLEMTQKTA